MIIRAKYVGDGSEYFTGIPARDMSDDEYQALTVEQRKDVRESGLYEVMTDREYEAAARDEKRTPRAAPPPPKETETATEPPPEAKPQP